MKCFGLQIRPMAMVLSLVLAMAVMISCQADKSESSSKRTATEERSVSPEEPAPQPAQTPTETKPEVVFDPRNPPSGYTKCHRNHCHRVGGGVASYHQVMQEMGATSIVGAPKPGAMPPAPPDVANPPLDAEVTESGLMSKVLSSGRGSIKPGPTSQVTVHYTGWTMDGKAIDSSVARGKPASFPLNRVIPGWTEGLQLMTVGEERRFWIPAELAYQGRAGRPAGMLVFDVMLMAIK